MQLGLSNFAAYEVAEIVMTCHYNNWVRPTIYQGKKIHLISPFANVMGCDNLLHPPMARYHAVSGNVVKNVPILTILGMYNAITRSLDQELIPACKRYGLDVVVYNPIAGGLFSGTYPYSMPEIYADPAH